MHIIISFYLLLVQCSRSDIVELTLTMFTLDVREVMQALAMCIDLLLALCLFRRSASLT